MGRFRSLAGLLAAAGIASVAHATPPQAGFPARADAIVQKHVAARTFSGVVLVADHGKPVFRKAYGLANREWNIPATPETVFRIGSTTKTFTAAAILRLAEKGALSLDAPIARYYAAAPAAWSGVTLRQLLNHTSGIPDFVQINGFIRSYARLQDKPEDLVALVRDQPLDFPPGSKFRYSNTGYALLGLVIEKVSGETYADYVSEAFLKPLGLAHTAYDREDEVVPRRASGYWLDGGAWKNARLWTSAAAYAAGALRSTADDLLAWDQALHTGKVLSQASFKAMFADDEGHGYGLGSFVETRHGHRLWDHGGNLPGFCSAFEYYPDDGITVIVLDNIEGQDAERLASELAGAWFGWRAKTP